MPHKIFITYSYDSEVSGVYLAKDRETFDILSLGLPEAPSSVEEIDPEDVSTPAAFIVTSSVIRLYGKSLDTIRVFKRGKE